MDNLKQLLSLIFSQQPSSAISSNPALKGLGAQDFDPNQDLSGALGGSAFSKTAFPSLIGGSILSAMPGRFEKSAGMGLDALGLLAALSS